MRSEIVIHLTFNVSALLLLNNHLFLFSFKFFYNCYAYH